MAAVMLGSIAQSQSQDCHCYGIVLNGSLNTADFNGGVGYGAEYVGEEMVSYAFSVPSTSAFAVAHAHTFAFARSLSSHGGHIGGGHGCHGGGHR
jgi:hypothetical protein